MLDGKDREQLHAIAGAMGVKAPHPHAQGRPRSTRSSPPPTAATRRGTRRRRRRARASRTVALGPRRRERRRRRPVAALAAEEDALAADAVDDARARRSAPATPRRGRDATGDRPTASDAAHAGTDDVDGDESTRRRARAASDGGDRRHATRRPRGRAPVVRRGQPRAGAAGAAAAARSRTAASPTEREFQGEPIEVEGLLDLRDEGYGFLRATGYLAGRERRVRLGVAGAAVRAAQGRLRHAASSRPQASNEKYPALLRVDEINGMTPDERAQPSALRGPHAAVPRLEAAASSCATTRTRSPGGSST